MEAIHGWKERFVNPINWRTSCGPPYNVKKHNHYAVFGDEAYLSKEMTRIADDLDAILESGNAPGFVARAVLKDEALKPEKKPRVFTILSSPANTLLTRVVGPNLELMRACFAAFECAVGVDMSSGDVMRLIHHLQMIQPELDALEEIDAVKLDKCWSGDAWQSVTWAHMAMARHLGNDVARASACLTGLRHTRYEIKGDVFEAPWNPSGQRATVEVNSTWMSIGDRYVYYKTRPELVRKYLTRIPDFLDWIITGTSWKIDLMPYRAERAIITYGDDILSAST